MRRTGHGCILYRVGLHYLVLVLVSTANSAARGHLCASTSPCVVSGPQAGLPGGGTAGASDSPDARRRNPIAVTAGQLQDGATKALAGPGGRGTVENPDGALCFLHVPLQ